MAWPEEVVVRVGGPPDDPAADVVVDDEAGRDEVTAAVDANPLASAALVLLLRAEAWRSVEAGIAAESATYSTLQAGPEFGRWLAGHARKERPPEAADPVRVRRDGDILHITLDRPHVRNAFDARTREALLDAFAVAAAEPALRVELDGAGPSFCSGGDLDEFGTFDDPASAHIVRVTRSAGRALAHVADRVTARVHGACVGAGVELPAFAGRVVAAPGSTFALPEVGMGLVPGAGGTVSITRRVGRHRAAWLAITGRAIDAETALAWGLVDEVA